MLESIVTFLQGLPPDGVLALTFVIAYIENLFPPSPSDVLLVFIGTVVGIGTIGFVPTLITATVGSVTGFATAYWLGRKFGVAIADSPLVPFITHGLIAKVERWFDKYHGLIIIVNRFMAGTRAVISFVAGITRMPFPRTTLYCAASALAWNAIMLWIGTLIGARWREVDGYLATYGWVTTGILVIIACVWLWRRRKKRHQPS